MPSLVQIGTSIVKLLANIDTSSITYKKISEGYKIKEEARKLEPCSDPFEISLVCSLELRLQRWSFS
jgi:hypothetical protein